MIFMGLHSTDILHDYKRRIQITIWVMAVFFLIMGLRFFYLQILKGKQLLEFSENNRIDKRVVKALRGKIYDKDGVLIADNRASFDLSLVRGYAQQDLEQIIYKMKSFLNWDLEESSIEALVKRAKATRPYDPFIVKKDISWEDLARATARGYWLNGVRILDQPVRDYTNGDFLVHAIGYMGEIGRRTLEEKRKTNPEQNYLMGDYIGLSGIEKLKEVNLRGENGMVPIVQDARGRELGEEVSMDLLPSFRKKEPIPGDNVYLTIDFRLQKIVEEAFDKDAGAVVAIDPYTGEIRALLSRPSFSPTLFTRGVSGEYWAKLMLNTKNPLYDRALRGHYPPGSVFKIVTAVAALSEGIIKPDFQVYCKGHYRLGRETKRCWKRSGHGLLKLREAIRHSCDVYFYELGNRLGIDTIAKYARMFGLGERTGIGINHEHKGLVPDSEWKQRIFKQPWVGGETLSVAVGQGYLNTTPIQIVRMLATLVNGGRLFKTGIIKKVETYDGEIISEHKPEMIRRLDIDKDVFEIVKDALVSVVNEPGGTAYWTVRLKHLKVAGKTGTAQVVRLDSARQDLEEHQDHAWFVAYAPVEKPQLVLCVMVEHGGHGSSAAGPIAKKILSEYFKQRIEKEKDRIKELRLQASKEKKEENDQGI